MIALTHAEQIEEFRDAVEAKVDDPELRHELSDIIAGFAEQQQELAREARGAEEAELALQMSRLDVQERKWRMRNRCSTESQQQSSSVACYWP